MVSTNSVANNNATNARPQANTGSATSSSNANDTFSQSKDAQTMISVSKWFFKKNFLI